jgi:hypothetical protein
MTGKVERVSTSTRTGIRPFQAIGDPSLRRHGYRSFAVTTTAPLMMAVDAMIISSALRGRQAALRVGLNVGQERAKGTRNVPDQTDGA